MDQRSAYSVGLYADNNASADSNKALMGRMDDFILRFRLDNKFVYRYIWHGYSALVLRLMNRNRDQLKENALLKKYYCDVDIDDLNKFDEELSHRLQNEPAELIPLVRKSFESFRCGLR